MTKVKICGIRTLDEARAVIEAGADSLGFHVELPHSKMPIGTATASAIIARLPPYVASVAVTTLTDSKAIIRLVKATGVNTLQLHNDVSVDAVHAVKADFFNVKVCVMVHVSGEESIERARKFEDAADAILLDTVDKTSGLLGGTGKTHDWDISRRIVESVSIPVILAGGLTPDNVAEAIKKVRPYAVDVQSGVTHPDGSKDIEKVRLFIERARAA